MVLFEHSITFDREVAAVWDKICRKQRVSLCDFLLLSLRWFLVAGAVAAAFYGIDTEVSHPVVYPFPLDLISKHSEIFLA